MNNEISDKISVIGKRLETLRKEKGHSAQEISDILEIDYGIIFSRQRYSRCEKGEQGFPLDVLLALSQLYKCDVAYILGEIPEHTYSNNQICNEIGISEKAIINIKEICNSEYAALFGLLCECEEISSDILPILCRCADVLYEQKTYYINLSNILNKLDDEQMDFLTRYAEKMANSKKEIPLSNYDAGIYQLSIKSTQIYNSIIEQYNKSRLHKIKKSTYDALTSLGYDKETIINIIKDL